MTSLDFSKYHANGNDFILIDDRKNTFPVHDKSLIQRLCHRNLGIGADGIILFQLSSSADARMRILNSDGSEAESCGNGLCCFTKFMQDIGYNREKYSIEIDRSIVKSQCNGDKVDLEMQDPIVIEKSVSLSIDGQDFDICHVDSGVPHAVCFVENIDQVNIKEAGAKIRYHPYFKPHGVNVDFAEVKSKDFIKVRTYERGIEDETCACGTGAVAVAVASRLKLFSEGSISLVFKYGTIVVGLENKSDFISNVLLTNQVNFVYSGRYLN